MSFLRCAYPSLDFIGSSSVAETVSYWQTKRAGRAIPSRADLDPVDLPRSLKDIALLDILPEQNDFRFRVFGSSLALRYGRDYTGKTTLDVAPDDVAATLHGQLTEAVKRWKPVLMVLSVGVEFQTRFIERVALPLSDDGRHINKIMTVSGELAESDCTTLKFERPECNHYNVSALFQHAENLPRRFAFNAGEEIRV